MDEEICETPLSFPVVHIGEGPETDKREKYRNRKREKNSINNGQNLLKFENVMHESTNPRRLKMCI